MTVGVFKEGERVEAEERMGDICCNSGGRGEELAKDQVTQTTKKPNLGDIVEQKRQASLAS